MKHLKQEPSSHFNALLNYTVCCSSGPDRKPYKNISTFLVFYPLVMSFDSLFGFILVFGENMSTYTHVLSILSFPMSYKYILIVLNSDSSVCRG